MEHDRFSQCLMPHSHCVRSTVEHTGFNGGVHTVRAMHSRPCLGSAKSHRGQSHTSSLHFAWVVDDAKCIVATRVYLCVCVSLCLSVRGRTPTLLHGQHYGFCGCCRFCSGSAMLTVSSHCKSVTYTFTADIILNLLQWNFHGVRAIEGPKTKFLWGHPHGIGVYARS